MVFDEYNVCHSVHTLHPILRDSKKVCQMERMSSVRENTGCGLMQEDDEKGQLLTHLPRMRTELPWTSSGSHDSSSDICRIIALLMLGMSLTAAMIVGVKKIKRIGRRLRG